MKGSLIVTVVVVGLLTGSHGFFFGTETPDSGTGPSWMDSLRAMGSALREALQPTLKDLRESVSDIRRQFEESGGVDGLRLDAERAIEEIRRHGDRASERTRGFLSRVLDKIEAKTDDASSSVRSGLTALVRHGRRVLHRAQNHQNPDTTATPNPNEWISIGRLKRRARRDTGQLIPVSTDKSTETKNPKFPLTELRSHLEGYNANFKEIVELLRDIRYELSDLRRGLKEGPRAYDYHDRYDHSRAIQELEDILAPTKGSARLTSGLRLPRVRRQAPSTDHVRMEDVHDYLVQYKEGFKDISNLLKDIRFELNSLREKVL